jgi:hypothetical protein
MTEARSKFQKNGLNAAHRDIGYSEDIHWSHVASTQVTDQQI